MSSYVYDEEASERLHVDVVYEVDDTPGTQAQWLESMRRLNSIKDRLARRILALHRDCGSGHGPCDWDEDEAVSWSDRKGWGCETTALVASHFGIEYPEG